MLDRTKEPGAPAEPLHLDVMAAFSEEAGTIIIGGRYGLGSKEFTPADALAVFAELARPTPRHRFTVGIVDDVTHLSLDVDASFRLPTRAVQAMFFGLGSDGTVGANKNSIKLIGEHTDLHAQGYFVYDSKKSGSMTVSHLRFGPDPIRSAYLIDDADFVACHQFGLLARVDVLGARARRRDGAAQQPVRRRRGVAAPACRRPAPTSSRKDLAVLRAWTRPRSRATPASGRASTRSCSRASSPWPTFFRVDRAIELVKDGVDKAYGHRGPEVVERNMTRHRRRARRAAARSRCRPARSTTSPGVAGQRPRRSSQTLIAGLGDSLPVSAMSVDGTFATGTVGAGEARSSPTRSRSGTPSLCIDCGKCAIVCPHAAIRMKAYTPETLAGAPEGFLSKPYSGQELGEGTPAHDPGRAGRLHRLRHLRGRVPGARQGRTPTHKAIDLAPARRAPRRRTAALRVLPRASRTSTGPSCAARPSRARSCCGRCSSSRAPAPAAARRRTSSCVTQLLGDRMVVANATGCSSIYGGNLPTTPWTQGRATGAARPGSTRCSRTTPSSVSASGSASSARPPRRHRLLRALADELPSDVVAPLVEDEPGVEDEAGIIARRQQVERLRDSLADVDDPRARRSPRSPTRSCRPSVWIVGGDGWAYDIDFGGLDHVLASGRNVNILVLDTEVYSNTGGQASKSTPRGAAAKFASTGKATKKKDLGLLAQAYGDVYVAQIALGANETQAVRAILEAAAWPGPSLILAYSTCIAHGIEMATSMAHQKEAVTSGYWPLYRFHPSPEHGHAPVQPRQQDAHDAARASSRTPRRATPSLDRTDHERAEHLLHLAQADIDERWHYYEQLAGVERSLSGETEDELGHEPDADRRPTQVAAPGVATGWSPDAGG